MSAQTKKLMQNELNKNKQIWSLIGAENMD